MAETQVSASALSGSGRDGMLRGASQSGGSRAAGAAPRQGLVTAVLLPQPEAPSSGPCLSCSCYSSLFSAPEW